MKLLHFSALGGLLLLTGCATNPNPNVNTYGWRPPAPPDPNSRSYMGFDPTYEQLLIDQYVASHAQQVKNFRERNELTE